jgi:hypothetical protein
VPDPWEMGGLLVRVAIDDGTPVEREALEAAALEFVRPAIEKVLPITEAVWVPREYHTALSIGGKDFAPGDRIDVPIHRELAQRMAGAGAITFDKPAGVSRLRHKAAGDPELVAA